MYDNEAFSFVTSGSLLHFPQHPLCLKGKLLQHLSGVQSGSVNFDEKQGSLLRYWIEKGEHFKPKVRNQASLTKILVTLILSSVSSSENSDELKEQWIKHYSE